MAHMGLDVFSGPPDAMAPRCFCDAFPKDRDFSIFAGLKKTVETGEIDNELRRDGWKIFPAARIDNIRKKGIEEIFGWCETICAQLEKLEKQLRGYVVYDPSFLNSTS